jgi:hypothetical protein
MIPRFLIVTVSSCDPTDEFERGVSGRGVVISWLGFVVEVSVGRRRP